LLTEFAKVVLQEACAPQTSNQEVGRRASHCKGGKIMPLALGMSKGPDRDTRGTWAVGCPPTAVAEKLVALRASSAVLEPSQLVRRPFREHSSVSGEGATAGRARHRRQLCSECE
jgi:hypothetical protein